MSKENNKANNKSENLVEQEIEVEEAGASLKPFQAKLDYNVHKAIKMMAAFHGVSVQIYLNNFFKDFIPFEAKNTKNSTLYQAVEEVLSQVPYRQ